jgi:hypothetical protein
MTFAGATGGWAIVVGCVVAFLLLVVAPTVAVLMWRRADRRRTPEEHYRRAFRPPRILPWHSAAERHNHHNPFSGHHGGAIVCDRNGHIWLPHREGSVR